MSCRGHSSAALPMSASFSSSYTSSKRKSPGSSSSSSSSKRSKLPEENVPVSVSSPSPAPSFSAPSASVNNSAMSGNLSGRLEPKIIVVLVKAGLETFKGRSGFELLSADTHKATLAKLKKNPSEFRPDIVHQSLLTLLDSPLNKAGLLKVFIQTDRGVLIEVNSAIRIPRTFKRFAGLMVQLLHKLKIRSADSAEILLRVIKNPIESHLPVGSLKIGTSVQGDLVEVKEFAEALCEGSRDPQDTKKPIVFCFGSHAVGPADVDWTERSISVSKFPLSASVALGRLLNAFEYQWKII